VEREFGIKRQVVGMNVGRCAGAGVEGHLHIHLVPDGDGPTTVRDLLDPMPESLSEELRETRDRLARAWARSDRASQSSYS
jgi:ATP adenylyltransferase